MEEGLPEAAHRTPEETSPARLEPGEKCMPWTCQ